MKCKSTVHKLFQIGAIDRRIFGGFVEHIGRCVYNGLYEPTHPDADADGVRNDVAELVRALDMPVTRYPGGNFVSGYDWKDGIGPREQRPARAEYAWEALETNEIGVDEFMKWCRKAGTAPLMAVNLGTGSLKDAQQLVEYCNFRGGTYWSDMRRKNGALDPYGIKVWCLGNEMDSPTQIGHKTAQEYGRLALECGKMMRMVDPSIELSLCGSSSVYMPTYGEWDSQVVEAAFDTVDYLALHNYFGYAANDRQAFVATPSILEWNIGNMVAICDAAAAKRKSPRRINLAVDEWNVWYRGNYKASPENIWQPGRSLNEEIYDMADVLVVGGALMTMLNHADRVKIGCIAQTVNVIAPIMTRPGGGAWRQTTYYPFLYLSKYGRGVSLAQHVDSPVFSCDNPYIPHPVAFLLSSAVYDEAAREIRVFAINRSLDEEMEFSFDMLGFSPSGVADAVEIHHDSLDAVNTETEENVRPAAIGRDRYRLKDAELTVSLKPASWNMFRIALV